MVRPNTTIRAWLRAVDPETARQLAQLADTSVPHLRHIAAGRRNISAELAQRLAHAAERIPAAPELLQVDLCGACRKCPLLNGR